jgi:hypothetical protein
MRSSLFSKTSFRFVDECLWFNPVLCARLNQYLDRVSLAHTHAVASTLHTRVSSGTPIHAFPVFNPFPL